MNNLIIYHGDCNDGFGAAFAAYLHYGKNAEYYPGMYDGNIPDVKNKNVCIFDYHFKENVLLDMKNKANDLILKDHHFSAEQIIGHLPFTFFDNSKSGAVLAWEHFFKDPIPEMFLWLQDRDLFENKIEESKYFHYFLASKKYSFEDWNNVFEELKTINGRKNILDAGKTIFDYYNNQMDLIIKHHAIPLNIEEKEGWIINTNRLFISEIGNELAKRNNTFALIWSLTEKGMISCSVRSVGDCSARLIAEQFGGGGHEHAAKFNMKLSDFTSKFLNF